MASIEYYVSPRWLYRYRPFENLDREISAKEQGYVYCSAYEDLNDPMEGLFTSSLMLRKSANYRAIRDTIVDKKAQIGMCSFSEYSLAPINLPQGKALTLRLVEGPEAAPKR